MAASTPPSRKWSPPPGVCPPLSPTFKIFPCAGSWAARFARCLWPGTAVSSWTPTTARLSSGCWRTSPMTKHMQEAFLSGEDIHAVHRLSGLPGAPFRGHAGDAPQRQGRQLRHCLRHFRLVSVPGHWRQPRGGQGVYGTRIWKTTAASGDYMKEYRRRGQGAGLCHHPLWAAAVSARAQEQQFQPPLLRRAGGAEHAHPGHGGGYHQAGHDPGG